MRMFNYPGQCTGQEEGGSLEHHKLPVKWWYLLKLVQTLVHWNGLWRILVKCYIISVACLCFKLSSVHPFVRRVGQIIGGAEILEVRVRYIVIGASLSEPHLVMSTADFPVCMYVSIYLSMRTRVRPLRFVAHERLTKNTSSPCFCPWVRDV